MPVHGDLRAVGQDEIRMVAEFLDEAEDVVPAAAVEAGGVLAQLVEDLVHLEGGEDGFDQHGGADGAARNAQLVLREEEDVVPQARLEMALQFGQVEIRAGAVARSSALALWKKNRPKSNSDAEMGSPSTRKCFSSRCQPRGRTIRVAGPFSQLVALALRAGVGDGAVDRVAQVDLAVEVVSPGGRVGVLEIGHEDAGAGVQGVDDHLAVDRPGDLDAAVLQVRGDRRHLPVSPRGSRRFPAGNRACCPRRSPAAGRASSPGGAGGAPRSFGQGRTESASLFGKYGPV